MVVTAVLSSRKIPVVDLILLLPAIDLLAQFMSPKSNTRTDDYSAMPGNSLRLLNRIVTSIRAIAPPRFILGVKISSADYVEAGSGLASDEKDDILSMEEERAVGHVKEIARWKMVDFIEISGGDYEAPGLYFLFARSTQ